MGMLVDWVCDRCGYEAVVSGRDDVGLMSGTTTVICRGCRKLYDVVVTTEPWSPRPEGWQPRLRCPTGVRRHLVERWVGPGPCPRCRAEMRQGGNTMILWD